MRGAVGASIFTPLDAAEDEAILTQKFLRYLQRDVEETVVQGKKKKRQCNKPVKSFEVIAPT